MRSDAVLSKLTTMEKEDIDRKTLLKFLAALRDAGIETKFSIYDSVSDDEKHWNQVVAAAVVSKEEIVSEDFTVIHTFTEYLHSVDTYQLQLGVVHHERMAVVMNADDQFYSTHGECRLFDPDRKHLSEIIDEGMNRKTEVNNNVYDTAAHGVFEKMKLSFRTAFPELGDPLILLYSYYIPCSIDLHNCAKLLREFVRHSGHEMIVVYEDIYELTDANAALSSLEIQNIVVVSDAELNREIHEQMVPVMGNVIDDGEEWNDDSDYDIFHDIVDYLETFNLSGNRRKLRNKICRKVVKLKRTCLK